MALQEPRIIPLETTLNGLSLSLLTLELEANSKAGYDALDSGGTRIQIKGRRLASKNASRQLSAIRKYEEKDFDILVAILFNEQFDVSEAYEVPHEVIGDYARYTAHGNSHTLIMGGSILTDSRVKCIRHAICN